jgi:uncharacterized protein (DUF58 family)
VPHVRDVIADRELETWVMVDLSPSMYFGTASMEKRDLAVAAVATMGLLTHKVGDRFGGYVLRDGRLRRWPARAGRLALFGLLRSLLREDSHGSRINLPSGGSLSEAITTVARAQRKRGLRVVVSDFIDLRDAATSPDVPTPWERAMRELASRHQVIAIEIIDPRELDIPDVGSILIEDAETGEVRELDTSSRRVRERYAAVSRLQRQRTARALRRCGAGHLVLRTDRDWVADTARFALSHRREAVRLHQPPAAVPR